MSQPWCRRPVSDGDPARVLLLHGLGGRPGSWDRFAAHVPEPFELWDVELPWHGLAGSGWSHRTEPVDALVDVLACASADGPEFDAVVAHSYAANLLAEAFAAGLVTPRPAVLVSPFYRARPEEFDWPTISYYLNEFHLTFTEALRVGETRRFPEAHRSWMAERLRDHIGPYGWMRFFEMYLRTPFLDVAAVTPPVLVVTGDADVSARVDDGRALADALPRGRFTTLDGCGHFPMLEQPDRLARLVRDFLSTSRGLAGQHVVADHAWS